MRFKSHAHTFHICSHEAFFLFWINYFEHLIWCSHFLNLQPNFLILHLATLVKADFENQQKNIYVPIYIKAWKITIIKHYRCLPQDQCGCQPLRQIFLYKTKTNLSLSPSPPSPSPSHDIRNQQVRYCLETWCKSRYMKF